MGVPKGASPQRASTRGASRSPTRGRPAAPPKQPQKKTDYQEIYKLLGGDRAASQLIGKEEELVPPSYHADVVKLRKRLRDQHRGVFKPRGRFIQYWDMVSGLALVYTLIVAPFEVGLGLPTEVSGLFIVNQVVSCVFLLDMIFQFFLPYPDPNRGEGGYERNHWKLAKRYFCTWFLLDVLTIIPFDVMVLMEAFSGPVKGTKLLRILRLLKLLKVLKSSAIIERWQNSFAISSSNISLLSWSAIAVILLHWFTCAWCLIATTVRPTLRDAPGSDAQLALELALEQRMEWDDTCSGCMLGATPAIAAECANPCLSACERELLAVQRSLSDAYLFASESWLCRSVDSGYLPPAALSAGGAAGDVYIAALLVSMLQMVGGVSTILPVNVLEFAFFFVTILAGTVLFAAVQGVICGIVTTGDPDDIQWKQNMDALNFMMDDNYVSDEQRRIVRAYFRKARNLFKRRSYAQLIDDCLSPELKEDVRYEMSRVLFEHVWYLKSCDREFLEDVSAHLVRVGYSPKEEISATEHLNILTAGMATRSGAMIAAGACFGDIILTSVTLRDTTPARTLIYCEVARLERANFVEVLTHHPEAQAVIKQASVKLAMQRAMIILSLHVQRKQVAAIAVARKAQETRVAAEKQWAEAAAAGVGISTALVPAGRRPTMGGRQKPPAPMPEPEFNELEVVEEINVGDSFQELQPLLAGSAWREIDYDASGEVVGISSATPQVEGPLRALAEASATEQPMELGRMVLGLEGRIDTLTSAVQALVTAQGPMLAAYRHAAAAAGQPQLKDPRLQA